VYDPAPGTPNQSAYTGPKPLIYMEFNNLVGPGPNGGAEWTQSTDGLTYVHALADVAPGRRRCIARSALTDTRRLTK